MDASRWATQQLAEFVAAVSAVESESAAAIAAVERAAEALDADVGAMVGDGELIAAIGYPDGMAPVDELRAITPGLATATLDVPGVGACAAAAAALEDPPGARLVVAGRPLTREETGLLRGMARVTSMTMRMLRVVDNERAAREEVERLARDQAALRRVATIVAEAASREDVYAAVAEEIAQRLTADVVEVLRYEVDGTATIVGGWAVPAIELPIGARFGVEGEGVAVSVLHARRPVHVDRFDGPPGSLAAQFRSLGVRCGAGSPIVVEDDLWGVAIAAARRPEALPAGSEARIAEFTELVATAIANAEARSELRRIAAEQAALRRVATLIARGAAPDVVFAAVAEEVGRLLPSADVALVGRYHADPALEIVGAWSKAGGGGDFVGRRVALGGRNVSTFVFDTNRPARLDRFPEDDENPVTAIARETGSRSSAGAPISVDGRLWGVMIVTSTRHDALPPGLEHRLAKFTELVATAMANAQAREELRRVADEQAALRRVATLVARAAKPGEVFAAVAAETGQLFGALSTLVRFDPDSTMTVVGSWGPAGEAHPIATRWPLGGHNAATLVFETGRPARVDRYGPGDTSTATAAARRIGARSAVAAPIMVAGRLWGAAIAANPREGALPADMDARLRDFAELVAVAISNTEARDELHRIADEQAALRRVATLVAEAAPPSAVFAAVASEVGRLLLVDRAFVARYSEDDTVTLVAGWSTTGESARVGFQGPTRTGSLGWLIRETGRPARIDDFARDSGAVLEFGIRSAVGAPITVEGSLWGFITVASTSDEPPPPDTEMRLADFTELLATAIANANAQSELTASRARIVASADETRRRIERDLHDGAQQRLVTLALSLRLAMAKLDSDPAAVRESLAAAGVGELAAELDSVAAGLNGAIDELREFARGIHPRILAEGGLRPALRSLGRRSPIPVELDVRVADRLPDRVEVGAYYVVSEALTNAAKHARATGVQIEVAADEAALHIAVRDDGVGGADFSRGSGLLGLRDRVEALGGRLALRSDPGVGTSLSVELPLAGDAAVAP